MIQTGVPVIFTNLLLFLDTESLIRYGGLLLILLVVYGNTGLFFLFFLPAGAVLFSAGVLTAAGDLHYSIFTVCSLLIIAAVLGSVTGYLFGRKAGPSLYRRKDSRFFRRQYLFTAESFYKKYGWLALTLGLYIPVVRTFAPVVAGMVRMNFRRFIFLAFTGAVIWVISFVLAGYYIGKAPFLMPWLKYIVIAFILIVTIPLLVRTIREMKKAMK